MRSLIVFFLFTLILGCSVSEDPDPVQEHSLVGTSWEGPDDVAELLYGGNNVMVFEFMEEPDMQRLYIRNGNVRRVVEGTYLYEHPNVEVTIEDNKIEFKIKNTVMEAEGFQTLGGGNLILQKK